MTAPAQVQHRFSGSALLFLAPVLLLLVFSARQVADGDTFWHLKTGELIATQHQIPRTDPFSLVNEGKPWVNFEWLSQLAFYIVYRLAGPRGLVLGKTLILGCAFLLFALAGLEWKKPLLGSTLLTLAIFTASERFMERPEIFSYLLLGAFVFILHRYRQGQFGRLIFILPVLQALWENLHGGTLLGIETVGAYAVGQTLLRVLPLPKGWKEPVMDAARYRRLLLVAGLVVLATLVNPWGPQTLWIIFRTQAHQWTMANVAEWQRTYAVTPPLPPDVIAYWAWLALAGLGFLLNFRRVDLNHLFLALGFLLISLLALRNTALFALVALPITARNFSLAATDLRLHARLQSLHLSQWLAPGRVVAMAGLAGVCLWLSWFVVTDRYYLAIRSLNRFGWNLSTLIYPWPLLDFLAQSGIQGPLFNEHNLGGYLIWREWPTYRVFLDSRAFIYDPSFMADYSRALREPSAWKALCDRYQFRLAVVLHTSQGLERLRSILAHDPDWTPVYLDETGVIFARNLPENAEWIARRRLDLSDLHSLTFTAPSRSRPRRRLGWFTAQADPMPTSNAAVFFEKVDQYDPAATLLQQALQIDSANPRIMSDLAGMEVMRRRWSEAETWGRRAVAGDPSLVDAWIHLGDALFQQERLSEAVWAYGQAISLDPKRYPALENRGVALGRLQRYAEATSDLEAALRQQADHPRPWCNLAYIYDLTRDPRATFVWKQCLAGLTRDGGDPAEIARVRARLGPEAR